MCICEHPAESNRSSVEEVEVVAALALSLDAESVLPYDFGPCGKIGESEGALLRH